MFSPVQTSHSMPSRLVQAVSCAALLAAAFSAPPALAGGRCVVTPVAAVGQAAPGTAGAIFSDFSELVSIDDQGRAWFVATVSGGDTTSANSTGVWRANGVQAALVLRAGQPAPGTSTMFSGFGPAAPGDAGACLFAQLGDTRDGSVWTGVSGSVVAAALKGQVPGGVEADLAFDSFEGLTSSNDAGETAFVGYVTGPDIGFQNNQGIWLGSSGATTLLARRGDRIPGGATGVVYAALGFPMLNNTGRVAFNATASGTGITTSNDQFLATGASGQVTVLRREGTHAPGLATGIVFADAGPFSLADSGDVAFYSTLSGTGVNGTNRTSLWIGSAAANVRLAVRAGITAPGTGGAILGNVGPSVVINSLGTLAFPATLGGAGVTTENDSAVYVRSATGAIRLVAREGDPAPGISGPDGVFASFSAFQINDSGQLLFRAQLAGGGMGLFFHDPVFGLVEVCREGRTVRVGPDDFRTVRAIGATFDAAPGDGRWAQLTPSGRAAYAAAFTDGSSAVLLAKVGCAADFNFDAQLDFFDYVDFAMSFSAGDPSADFTGDGSVDFFDYLDFIGAYSGGC
jgi:hypothetical protein